MAKFNVGDVLDRTSNPYSFWSKGGYVVYQNDRRELSIKDDDGTPYTIDSYPGDVAWVDECFTKRTPVTPEDDKALAWLKAKITERAAFSGISEWNAGFDTALESILYNVYSLQPKVVPQTITFVPAT